MTKDLLTLPLDHETIEQLKVLLEDKLLGLREDRGELTIWIRLDVWHHTLDQLRDRYGYLELNDYTAVDYLDRDPRFDLSTVLTHPEKKTSLRVKTLVEEGQEAPTLTDIWPGSNWFEREIFDLFGIEFTDHPDQRRLLLPFDYQGHPLRKDYPVTGPVNSAFR